MPHSLPKLSNIPAASIQLWFRLAYRQPMTAGRPTLYKPEFNEQARKLCMLGATDCEVADFLGIGTTTYYRWREEHEEFGDAVLAGKEHCDDLVEKALFQRAIGFDYEAVKVVVPAGAKEPLLIRYPARMHANVSAAQHWLRFRRPDQWSDRRHEVDDHADLGVQLEKALRRVKEHRDQEMARTLED